MVKTFQLKEKDYQTVRQKTNKDIETLNITINQLDLTDINRTLNSTPADYTYFPSAYETFTSKN